ncbi:MAG: FecR family protein [Bacteroidota bacterium]
MEFKLIVKKLNNTLNAEEKTIFDAWYRQSEEHRIYFDRVRENYLKGHDVVDIQKGWATVSSKINAAPKRKTAGYWKYAAAIAVLFALGSSPFLFNDTPQATTLRIDRSIKASPIPIGTDKAVLTLEDGSNVALEKGKTYTTGTISSNGAQLTYSNSSGTPPNTVAYNVLTIPRGGQFFLVLADGTKIWLNSESKLRYPITFLENEPRQVDLLYGEAYFDVSPSSAHKGARFIVAQKNQRIEVLGTEFNVKAYGEDAMISTTLVEGKVSLQKGAVTQNLSPGQQSRIYPGTDEITVENVDIYNEISWKNGFFSFEDKPLEDIMKVLSRWYDVEVVYANDRIKKMKFNGVFRKSQRIDDILMIIENTNEVDYDINEKTITMK